MVHDSLTSGQYKSSAASPTGQNQSDWGGGIFQDEMKNNGRTKCGGAFKLTLKESRTCSEMAENDISTKQNKNLLLKSSQSLRLQFRSKWTKEVPLCSSGCTVAF